MRLQRIKQSQLFGRYCLLLAGLILGLGGMFQQGKAQVSIDPSLEGRNVLSIEVHGNEKTRSFVILREMKQQEGEPLNPGLVAEDQKRILNLFLFTRVIILAEERNTGVVLRVIVSERWYIFPFPILFINEKDWNKISYGAGISHANFRGRAETLDLRFWLGYNPGVVFEYRNPWFAGDHKLYTGLAFSRNSIRSKHFSEKIDEKHTGLSWFLGKRFGYHTHISLNLGYRSISFDPAVEGAVLSDGGRDAFPSLGVTFLWDRRDLKEYPRRGWLVNIVAVKKGIPGRAVDYSRYGWDLRGYLPVNTAGSLALRWASHFSNGRVPVYDKLYIGYRERIRGHFYQKYEGEIRSLASAEYRFAILPLRYFSYSDSPYLQDFKFGISGGIFADAGVCRGRQEPWDWNEILYGCGIGLHFHLPYINLLRFEVAFDEDWDHQFILDLYVMF